MRSLLQLTLDFFNDVAAPAQPDAIAPLAPHGGTANSLPHAPASKAADEPISAVLHPAQFTHPRASRQIRLSSAAGKGVAASGGECVVAYELRRVKRKTIGFTVGADGLVVSAPRWVAQREIEQALQEKAAWIVRKLEQAQDRQQRQAQLRIQWQEGANIPFLGESVIIVIDPRQSSGAGQAMPAMAQLHSDSNTLPGVPRLTLHVGLPHDASQERIRDAVQAWLMRQAKRIFEERLEHFAPQLGVSWTKLTLSNAESRWGSAASNGAIRLNWRLIHFRQSVIDYVVVHELAHLRVMDHSPRFWSTVESVMPDYAQRKSMLKDESIPKA